jgi:hypothetical protein
MLKQHFFGSQEITYEAHVIHRTGKKIPVELTSVAIFDELGNAKHNVGIYRVMKDKVST